MDFYGQCLYLCDRIFNIIMNRSLISEGNGNGDRDKDKDEDQYSSLQPEKVLQVSIILAELNHKYSTQNFKPS